MIGPAARAIVWAQWRSLINHQRRSWKRGAPLALLFLLLWYGFWAFSATLIAAAVADSGNPALLEKALGPALLGVFLYWQIVPLMMASAGVSLDLPRLIVYPIPHGHLFSIEVILRVTNCIEMLLIMGGLMIGVLLNPQIASVGVLGLAIYTALNLFLAAGLKDLLGRWMARKVVREVVVFALVLVAALPQVLLRSGAESEMKSVFDAAVGLVSPWGLCARFVLSSQPIVTLGGLIGWTLAAWLWARWQFERTLRFDAAEAKAGGDVAGRTRTMFDIFVHGVSRVFRDPLAALIEKEVRLLGRSARFRLLFLMGFSFGLLVWLPMASQQDEDSFLRQNLLTLVSTYASMLLGEICFWNSLGLDRAAAQAYFTLPIPFGLVLRSKNVAALLFVFLELCLVTLFCALIGLPISVLSIVEAFAVTLVFTTFLLSLGNLFSVRYPRPVDPSQSWKGGSVSRTQAYLLLLYPLTAAPVALAYGAEFAFDSQVAFYGVLLLDAMIAVVVYTISLESAVHTARDNREQIVMTLSRGEGLANS